MGRASRKKAAPASQVPPLRLDFGCGPNPREGFEGVDRLPFDGKVRHVVDLRGPWPWADGSVDEAHSSHFVEHLTATERVHFANELHRVLRVGGQCQVIVPHWSSCRAYGDPTHQWPPVSEMWFYYLSRAWRMGDPKATPPLGANAPHTDAAHNPDGFSCDFDATWGWALPPHVTVRNQEWQQFAVQHYKDVIQDMVATLTKKA